MKIAIPKNIEELKQRMNDPLFKNSYYLMLTSVVGSLLGFIFWMVVARFYSTAEVGLAAAIFSAMGLIAAFSGLGLNIGLVRYLPKEDDKQGLINSYLTIAVLFSTALAAVFIAGLDIWSPSLLFIRDNVIFLFSFIIFTADSYDWNRSCFSEYVLRAIYFKHKNKLNLSDRYGNKSESDV